MALPLVTIAMPAYNHENYIEEAINSVIDQTYQNIEFIIINDGSSDTTGNIIKSLENKCKNRFVNYVYIEQENKGISYTLNKILTMAKGEYFIVSSSDDTQSETRVEEKINFFLENPEYDFCYAGYNDIREDGSLIDTFVPGSKFELVFEEILLRKRMISYTNYMAKTKSLIGIGGYIAGIKIEDWELALRVEKNQLKSIFLPIVSYNHRFHNNNTITKYDVMFQARLEILEMYKDHPKYQDAVEFWKNFYNKYFYKNYYTYKFIQTMVHEIILYNNSSLTIVIYGNGAIGKIVSLLIPESNFCFIDQASTKQFTNFAQGELYSKDALHKIQFDYIFITPFYQNDPIEEELRSVYTIEPNKILKF